jgi:hypothetical protein
MHYGEEQVTEQDQSWQSFEGGTESPSSDPLSGLPSSLGEAPQEAKPRENASPETWKDMVRSVAVSTADLWQEVLDRLARLEANQEALINSLQEFRATMIEQQARPQLESLPFIPPPPLPLDQGQPPISAPNEFHAPPVQQEPVASSAQPEASGQPEPESLALLVAESPAAPEPPAPPERQWSQLPPVASLGSEELAGVLAAEFGPYATQNDHLPAPNQMNDPLAQPAPPGFQESKQPGNFQQDPVLSALFAEPPASQETPSSAQTSSGPPPPPDFSWSQEAEQLPPPEVAQRVPDPPITPDFFARVRKGIMGR